MQLRSISLRVLAWVLPAMALACELDDLPWPEHGEEASPKLCEAPAENACQTCSCEACRDPMRACNELEGLASQGSGTGATAARLCQNAVACVRDSGCGTFLSCLCGDLSLSACVRSEPRGHCAGAMFAAAEVTSMEAFLRVSASPPPALMAAMDALTCLYETCGGPCFGAHCGDGKVDPGEECDGGLHCNADCTLQPYCGDGKVDPPEQCDGESFCAPDCTFAPYCGDGKLDPPEQCDSTPDCTPHCSFIPSCGDGRVSPGEDCDGEPFCSAECRLPFCRDAKLDPGEACDDGNAEPGDGCSPACALEPVALCQEAPADACDACMCGTCAAALAACDGLEGVATEGPAAGAAKAELCRAVVECSDRAECAFTRCLCGDIDLVSCLVSGPQGPCAGQIFAAAEAYDVTTVSSRLEDPRYASGAASAVAACRADRCGSVCPDDCPQSCSPPDVCGDAVLAPEEECDGEPYCAGDCTVVRVCGDGVRAPGEECDGEARCADDCTLVSRCGDGFVDPGEECEEGPRCGADCKFVRACGDGYHDPGEACDGEPYCAGDCTLPHCGDARLDLGEACDHGNRVDGDGCSGACSLERLSCQGAQASPCEACWCRRCSDRTEDCRALTGVAAAGPGAGRPKAALCEALVDCTLRTRCRGASCYCGGADLVSCLTEPPQGPCAQEMRAAAETADSALLADRQQDGTYAIGVAARVSSCMVGYCDSVCR